MSNPRCDECGIDCCLEDMQIVYDSPDNSPRRTQHKFCSMSCMENYFFPDHKTIIKERDVEIGILKNAIGILKTANADLVSAIKIQQEEVEKLRTQIKELTTQTYKECYYGDSGSHHSHEVCYNCPYGWKDGKEVPCYYKGEREKEQSKESKRKEGGDE